MKGKLMKIVHATAELFPYAKTGGLADMVGSLAATLADNGHDISVFLPGYREVLENLDTMSPMHLLMLEMDESEVWTFSPRKNLRVFLICSPEKGTGITFPPTAAGFRDGLVRALGLFAEKPRLAAVQKRGMRKDFSWAKAVMAYERFYKDTLGTASPDENNGLLSTTSYASMAMAG